MLNKFNSSAHANGSSTLTLPAGTLTWDDTNGLRLHDSTTAGGVAVGGGGSSGAAGIFKVTEANGDWHNNAPNPQIFNISDFSDDPDVIAISQNGAHANMIVNLPATTTHGKIYTIKYTGGGAPTYTCTVQVAGGGNIDTVAGAQATISVDNAALTFIWDSNWGTYWLISDANAASGGSGSSTALGLDITADPNSNINLDDGATHDINGFSGLVIVNDVYDGYVYAFLCGGGAVLKLGSTNMSMGGSPPDTCTMTFTGGYTLTNTSGSNRTFGIALVKTRNNS